MQIWCGHLWVLKAEVFEVFKAAKNPSHTNLESQHYTTYKLILLLVCMEYYLCVTN